MSEHLELNMPLGTGAGQQKTEVKVRCGSCNGIIGTYSSEKEAKEHLHDACPRCGKSGSDRYILLNAVSDESRH